MTDFKSVHGDMFAVCVETGELKGDNKLPAKEVLEVWNNQVDTACVVCGIEQETENHILFSSDFSKAI